ncbi:arginyltransferase [Endozoicomonas sp. (ex Bugula neritina AB1)]|nr:arginyltransferase [Endozoicomonas sp. (ex Bugula neritina AB1)]
MSIHKGLKFFATQPHECSYLPEQKATTLFMDPQVTVNQTLYSTLADMGFRRSGRHIYRPHCHQCQECIPIRIPVCQFEIRRSQRKSWNRNIDLTVHEQEARYTDEYYQLYQQYINTCHKDGDMYPATVEQFCNFLAESPEFCKFYEFRLKGELVAVCVVDILETGLSAIYTFYNPDHARRSLGCYCILWLIEAAKNRGYDYLHLGYWVKNCRKMKYKVEYRPTQLYINQSWSELR